MNSNRDIFIKRINESHQINNNQKKEPNSVLTNVKTTKSIITPEGKSIFIKEGKNSYIYKSRWQNRLEID